MRRRREAPRKRGTKKEKHQGKRGGKEDGGKRIGGHQGKCKASKKKRCQGNKRPREKRHQGLEARERNREVGVTRRKGPNR